MKHTLIIAAATLALASVALTGCSKDAAPGVTPEQQAELDKAREENAKRGWIDVQPVTTSEHAAMLDEAKAKDAEANTEAVDPATTPADQE